MQRYEPEDIPAALDRLIETRLDLEEAHTRLQEYQRTTKPPEPPPHFNDVETLKSYTSRRLVYEDQLGNLEAVEEASRGRYEQAVEEVRRFLPDGSGVSRTYKRNPYVIELHDGEITIGAPRS